MRERELLQEISDLRSTVNDLTYEKNDLVNQINAHHTEKQDLYRDVNTWKEVVNKLTDENTQLKLIIEDLEHKNKKFSETLNLHLYNRAAQYKARTLQALQGSPQRMPQPGPPNYNYTAQAPKTPERRIGNVNPGSATTQPLGSSERLKRLMRDDTNPDNSDFVREMGEGAEESKMRKDQDDGLTADQFYQNVMERGQYGPARDSRLVNSNYALIGNLDHMEKSASPKKRKY